ncbi:MAG: response regulator, partial [Bdellovibrionales bacterium]|nr:response regulator [Bdellovibrionales bacterium]
DLVVTDVCMPQFDGIELLKAIREQHHNLPKVYVISGYAQQPIADIYNFGADGFFRKPFDSRSMLDAVRKATMSLQDQWKRAPSAEPHNELIFLGKLADSQIKFARGGFSALTSPGEWRVGDPIRFSIEVTDAEFLDICGTGIVRWKELNNEKTMLCSGIEITYIEEQFRLAFIQWLQKNSGIPFIPKL